MTMLYKKCLFYLTAIILTVSFLSCAGQEKREPDYQVKNDYQKEDLVLIHGLSNKHSWGDDFLEKAVSLWGSGNVFVVFTNRSEILYEKTYNSRTIIYCGEDNLEAGDNSIDEQVELLGKKIRILQETRNLGKEFSIIAHSMGGLVSRRYIYKCPGVVQGLVTLGTPHQGSPLADNFKWAGFLMGATDAIDNLQPAYLEAFNEKFPVKSAPLAENGKIYTIRGDCDGLNCFGWGGELFFGWLFITLTTDKDNDGLVPFDSAVIEGAYHIADFPGFDHIDLIEEPCVVEKASEYLIKE